MAGAGRTTEGWPQLEGQKVQDTLQVLPQPGLQAKEIDMKISWYLAFGGPLARVFIALATGVVETPTH